MAAVALAWVALTACDPDFPFGLTELAEVPVALIGLCPDEPIRAVSFESGSGDEREVLWRIVDENGSLVREVSYGVLPPGFEEQRPAAELPERGQIYAIIEYKSVETAIPGELHDLEETQVEVGKQDSVSRSEFWAEYAGDC